MRKAIYRIDYFKDGETTPAKTIYKPMEEGFPMGEDFGVGAYRISQVDWDLGCAEELLDWVEAAEQYLPDQPGPVPGSGRFLLEETTEKSGNLFS